MASEKYGQHAVPSGAVDLKPDFPYYNGEPTEITGGQWWIIIAATATAFLFLTLAPLPGLGIWGMWIKAIVVVAVPLLALRWAAPQHWTAIFRRLRLRDFGWMVLFFALNQLVTLAVAYPFADAVGAEANPATEIIGEASTFERVSFYFASIPQLIGEELVTILPFLALMYWLYTKVRVPRWAAIVIPWLVTALIFGALHLPTYDWNFVQAFLFIGVARIMLTLAFVVTKNLWVSAGAHILNDWYIFTVSQI